MSPKLQTSPASKPLPPPFDWHDANEFLPPDGEVVTVYQLYGWAVRINGSWLAVDQCGNRNALMWKPEFWRRQWYPSDPTPKSGGAA